ncbi:hypothetical protein ACFSHP_22675 [Novosphingobium panipatense]
MGAAEWRASLDAFLAWVLPGRFGLTLRLTLLLVVLGTALMQVRREVDHHLDRQSLPEGQAGNRAALTIILGGMFVGYLGFVLLSTTIEANLTFDGRYALPAYIFLVMLLSVQFTRRGSAKSKDVPPGYGGGGRPLARRANRCAYAEDGAGWRRLQRRHMAQFGDHRCCSQTSRRRGALCERS